VVRGHPLICPDGQAWGGGGGMVATGSTLRLRLHLSPNMHFVQSPSHGLSSGLYRSFDNIRGSFFFFSKVINIQPLALLYRRQSRALSDERQDGAKIGPGLAVPLWLPLPGRVYHSGLIALYKGYLLNLHISFPTPKSAHSSFIFRY
jgi:hypothetical protein